DVGGAARGGSGAQSGAVPGQPLTAPGPGAPGLSGFDPDGDNLTFSVVAQPGHGAVGMTADGHFTYTPTPGSHYVGPDSFTFKVSAGSSDTGRRCASLERRDSC